MSRTRDRPDPANILSGHCPRVPSSRLMDPKNAEPPAAPHQSTITNSGKFTVIHTRRHVPGLTSNHGIVSLISDLIDQIENLSGLLPTSVHKGTKDDKIYHVITNVMGFEDGAHSTFTRRMDILFGSDCRDEQGRFRYVFRGTHGMDLIVKYLRSILWKSAGIPFTIAAVKLTTIVKELEILCSETPGTDSSQTPSSSAPSNSKRAASDAASDAEEVPNKRKKGTASRKATVEDADDEDDEFPEILASNTPRSSDKESSSEDDAPASKQPSKKSGSSKRVVKDASRRRAKKPKLSQRSDPTVVGADGMLADIDVQPISETSRPKLVTSADVDHFFSLPFVATGVKGLDKLHHNCKLCGERIVKDLSSNRWHLATFHAPQYRKWATKNGFESRLEADVKARKAEATGPNKLEQQTLDPHLREKPERVIPYSDTVFRDAAIEWLIATDQPLGALEHPKFIEMINIAARATNGVKIPGRKSTREEIMALFNQQLDSLRTWFRSDKVTGKIHVTCDAWQANNADGYFVVTGHWIEEVSPGVWKLQEAILGFTRLNNAHHGVRLGQALFKIVQRVGIERRVGYVTCDNATNNGTMLIKFARQVKLATKQQWDPIERRINCLAHVINLATQKLISTYSQSLHFNSHEPTAHIPDTSAIVRDEIGLVRAIAVKERSSAKRKELFRNIQLRKKSDPAEIARQMVLDMKVRWSSTYQMLHRGWELRRDVDTFVFEMVQEEGGAVKRDKLEALRLRPDEWARVDLFLDLLACAEEAQHSFSSDLRSTLHLAIPALEKLHAQWKYEAYWPALEAAMAKVDEYYQKTSNSDAYLLAMVLDPVQKFSHIRTNWDEELRKEALENLEEMFKTRYLELEGTAVSQPTAPTKPQTSNKLRRGLSLTSNTDSAKNLSTKHADPLKPWRDEFELYFNVREIVPDGISTIAWWGMNAHRYPVWASLARDYLAIMSSSVSSERAFSSAGITISKRRNRLKGDVVKALQVLKCLIRRDLLFRKEALADMDTEEDDTANDNPEDDSEGWDCFLDDSAEDGDDSDYDI